MGGVSVGDEDPWAFMRGEFARLSDRLDRLSEQVATVSTQFLPRIAVLEQRMTQTERFTAEVNQGTSRALDDLRRELTTAMDRQQTELRREITPRLDALSEADRDRRETAQQADRDRRTAAVSIRVAILTAVVMILVAIPTTISLFVK